MSILDKHLAFVKDHFSFHDRRAREFAQNSPVRAKRHRETADTLKQLAEDIETASRELDRNGQSPPGPNNQPAKNLRLSLTEEDIVGIPPELLNELSLSAGDRTEFAILNLLEEAGGVISLDRLLIGLYKKNKEIHKRDKLVSRLYRMTQKNLVYTYPGKKGVYSSEPPLEYESSTQPPSEPLTNDMHPRMEA